MNLSLIIPLLCLFSRNKEVRSECYPVLDAIETEAVSFRNPFLECQKLYCSRSPLCSLSMIMKYLSVQVIGLMLVSLLYTYNVWV